MFIIVPLKDFLGDDSFTDFENQLLLGTTNIYSLPLTFLQKLDLSEMKETLCILDSPNSHTISVEKVIKDFKTWKERISTSLSTRLFKHYKFFIISINNNNDNTYVLFDKEILNCFNAIINATIDIYYPIKR